MFRKILVGLDGSAGARAALGRAADLALEMGAELHVLSVEEHIPAYAGTVDEVEAEERFQYRYLSRAQAEARREMEQIGIRFEGEILPGHPAEALARRAAEGGFDLLVIGYTGHSRLSTVLLGSTADRVVEHAPCDVLVVRPAPAQKT
jgi:nucleotide-binding universal stress UspA family protein